MKIITNEHLIMKTYILIAVSLLISSCGGNPTTLNSGKDNEQLTNVEKKRDYKKDFTYVIEEIRENSYMSNGKAIRLIIDDGYDREELKEIALEVIDKNTHLPHAILIFTTNMRPNHGAYARLTFQNGEFDEVYIMRPTKKQIIEALSLLPTLIDTNGVGIYATYDDNNIALNVIKKTRTGYADYQVYKDGSHTANWRHLNVKEDKNEKGVTHLYSDSFNVYSFTSAGLRRNFSDSPSYIYQTIREIRK